jgi:hypothetical protein
MPRLRGAAAVPALFIAVLLGSRADARAQAAEVAAFGGWGFGGALASPAGGQNVGMDAGPLFGAAFSAPISRTWRVEAVVSRQQSRLADESPDACIDLAIERYLAGIQEEKARGRTRAFGTFLVGATRFVPSGFESEIWFTIGLGLGVKQALSTHVGLRFEARGFYTPVTGGGATVCSAGRCVFAFSGSGVFQGDLTGGILVVF